MNWDQIRRQFHEESEGLEITYSIKNDIVNWFKEKTNTKKRTNPQNAALHLYFTMLADQLNNAGYTFTNYLGIEIPFTMELIKESIWKPTMFEMFNIKSTTKLTTKMINELIDVFSKHFGERQIYVEFPNWQSFTQKTPYS